uniref:DUF8040 domain-containing protein n=1 Tax=Ananas comosus var. bracteatus TaxID=296719 RepID=A0A6V7NTA2_ANACO|nr:unnamed protein product [Ananas comosus var. bracteatus]
MRPNHILSKSNKNKPRGMDNATPGCDVEGSSRRPNQIRSRTANWTDHVDSILLSLLMEEHALRNYVEGSFTRVAWIRIVQGWDIVNNLHTAGDATEWDAIIAANPAYAKCRDKPFPAYNSIAFLCGSTVATGHYGMSSETMQPPTVVSEAGTGGNENGGQCRSSRSPTPPLGQPAVGGYASDQDIAWQKKSDLGAEALIEMVEIGKQKLEIAREMINITKAIEIGELLNRYAFSSQILANIMTLLDEDDDYWDQVFVILYEQDYLTFATNTLHRRSCRTRPFSGHELVTDFLNGHSDRGYQHFRMSTTNFMALRDVLLARGLIRATRCMTADEQLAIFLFCVGSWREK